MAILSFTDLGLGPALAERLARLGLRTPTPIQCAAIPAMAAGRDLLGLAATGSGKTGAFGLPLVERLSAEARRPAPGTCRALVLAPTRELALQIGVALRDFAGGARFGICVVVGGTPRGRQIARIAAGVDVVIATPGRLTDLMRARAVALGAVRHFVIDEADRMLDMGFLEPVRRIAAHLPPDCQTALFSATMPKPVAALAQQLLRDPVRIEVAPPPEREGLRSLSAERVEPRAKRRRLIELVSDEGVRRAIVFCRTRKGADRLAEALARAGLAAAVIHGERSQDERRRALDAFRRGAVGLLVATDIVARGIDVPGVSHVFNFDLPDDPEAFVHRIGRTARAGARGTAVTLYLPDELPRLRAIERATGLALLAAPCSLCGPGLACLICRAA